jgi:hypothetical protein
MNKLIKFFAWFLLCVALTGLAAYLYVFRQQAIEIKFMPSEFSYCGKTISENDSDYKEIEAWLKNNQDDWVLSFVSYVPRQVYKHPAFAINVMDGAVTIYYKTDDGYPQYFKSINHKLELTCAESS